jgi:hypothetical protein
MTGAVALVLAPVLFISALVISAPAAAGRDAWRNLTGISASRDSTLNVKAGLVDTVSPDLGEIEGTDDDDDCDSEQSSSHCVVEDCAARAAVLLSTPGRFVPTARFRLTVSPGRAPPSA